MYKHMLLHIFSYYKNSSKCEIHTFIHSFIHSFILPLTRNTTTEYRLKYIKDNIQYSNWIIYKIKCGKGKEGYIEAGGL